MKKKSLLEDMFADEFRTITRLSNTISKARISRDNLKCELHKKIVEELLSGDLSIPTRKFLNLKTGNNSKTVIEILVERSLNKERYNRGVLLTSPLKKFLLNNLGIVELESLPEILDKEFSLIKFKLYYDQLSIDMITPKPSRK